MPRLAWTPKLIAVLVLLVLSLILLLQNWGHVYIYILFWDFRLRLIWALLGTFLLGALLGWMVPNLREEAGRLRTRLRRSSPDQDQSRMQRPDRTCGQGDCRVAPCVGDDRAGDSGVRSGRPEH